CPRGHRPTRCSRLAAGPRQPQAPKPWTSDSEAQTILRTCSCYPPLMRTTEVVRERRKCLKGRDRPARISAKYAQKRIETFVPSGVNRKAITRSETLTDFAAGHKRPQSASGRARRNSRPSRPRRSARALLPISSFRRGRSIKLIAEGHSNKEVADVLSIGLNTVESHRGSALRKLNLSSTADLVRYAIRNKLVELQGGTLTPLQLW